MLLLSSRLIDMAQFLFTVTGRVRHRRALERYIIPIPGVPRSIQRIARVRP